MQFLKTFQQRLYSLWRRREVKQEIDVELRRHPSIIVLYTCLLLRIRKAMNAAPSGKHGLPPLEHE